jgi:parvulin-like peptidyl-prolyl isomerase
MTEVSPQTAQIPQGIQPPEVEKATDEAISNYLRHTYKMAEVAALAEQDAKIIKACDTLGIVISDEELQVNGDEFRLKNKLLGASETLAWLEQQRISSEEWTQGIRIRLLTQKLKNHLFADSIDSHYLNNRQEYHRAAFSQILVPELSEALQIVQTLRAGKESFCAMALEHSKAQPSGKQGGFVGVRFLSTLMPEIKEAISGIQEGEIIDPIKTRIGYHVLRIEKWFPPVLSESVREEILEILFQTWLNTPGKSNPSKIM